MSGRAWMPFYVGDYLADTMHLSRDQHGAYLLLIFAYWQHGGPLPDDNRQLAEIAKTPISQWQSYRKVLAPFFSIKQGLWHHKRADIELEKMAGHSSAKKEAGRKGAAKRWGNAKNGKNGGNAGFDQWQNHAFANGRNVFPPDPPFLQPQPQEPPPFVPPTGGHFPPPLPGGGKARRSARKPNGGLANQMEGFAIAADNDAARREAARDSRAGGPAAQPLLDRKRTNGNSASDSRGLAR